MQQEFEWAATDSDSGQRNWLPPAGRLFRAIQFSEIEVVQQVLEEGFDCRNFWTHDGKSLLRYAGERGMRRICEMLVRYGADPNEQAGKRKYSLLHSAAAASNFGFASILLDLGANPSPLASNNATPLHFASRAGLTYLVAKLIEHGAAVDAQDTQGRSPLLLAFQKSHRGVIKKLLNSRSDPDLADQSGVTPRMVAESRGPPFSDLIRG